MKSLYSANRVQRPWLLVAAVLVSLLGYSAFVAALLGRDQKLLAMLALTLPLGCLTLIFTTRHFQLVVLALPIAALALPIELPTGTASRLPISMVLTLLLTMVWGTSIGLRGSKLAPSPLNRPLLIFSAICIISLPWGMIWRDPVLIDLPKFIVTQIGQLAVILLSIGATLLIGNFVTTAGQLKYIVGVFIGLGMLMTLTQLLHIQQSFLNDRGLWGTWLIGPAYGLMIAQPRLGWRWRGLLAILIALTFYQTMVVNSGWLSGWIPSIVAIYAITFLHSRKVFIVLLIAGVIAGFAARGFFSQVVQENVDEGSDGRVVLWEQNMKLIQYHWLLGTGPAGYALYYMTYTPDSAEATHNNYFDIVAQFGLLGLLAWLWLSAVSVWEGWQLARRTPPGFLRTLAIVATGGWVGALAAMLLGDWVLPFAYTQTIGGYKYTVYSWLFLGTLISIRQILLRNAREPASDYYEQI